MDWQRWGARLRALWRAGTEPAAERWGRRALAGERRRAARLLPAAQQRRPAGPSWAELQLYDDMRCSFPVLDVAITRLVQLCGHPRVEAAPALQRELELWMERLPAGPGQRGLGGWVEAHLDRMLVFGRAVGLLALAPSGRDIAAVANLDPREVILEVDPATGAIAVFHRPPGTPPGMHPTEPLPPARTLVSLHAPQGDGQGTSLLRSLPFVAEAASIIQNATAQVWQRAGAPSFHVNWRPERGFVDPQGSLAAEVAADLQRSFVEIMEARRHGEVRDLFTTGEVTVAPIGGEGVLAIQEPFRVFTEQMVAVTGLPPWLLGLHWSSTERLSRQQADLLVAHIEGLRREVQPQIEYLLELRQRLTGGSARFRVTWPPVHLRDATEQARAEAWAEQARQRRIENCRRMWELGFWSQERAAREADPTLERPDRRLERPPQSGEPPSPRLPASPREPRPGPEAGEA